MKKKKFERQQAQKLAKKEHQRQDFINNLSTVMLTPVDNQIIKYIKEYRWECPNHDGTFTFSMKINEQWGHPVEFKFCGVCCKYHNYITEEEAV